MKSFCQKINEFSLLIVACVLVVVFSVAPCGHALTDPSVPGFPASWQLYRAVEGSVFTVQLVTLPDRLQAADDQLLDYFEATPDSNFWWISKSKLNPCDWLRDSIVFREAAGFRVHFGKAEDDSLEVFDFGEVGPATYRVTFDQAHLPAAGRYMLRYEYKGQVVLDNMVTVVW